MKEERGMPGEKVEFSDIRRNAKMRRQCSGSYLTLSYESMGIEAD
jgi:hypothetical protein